MNILIIFTDQQRKDTIGAYGSTVTSTPNLDKLAKESAVFENAVCSQPVCSPSRGSLVTGQYPHTHGCIINCGPAYPGEGLREETQTIAEMLKPYGYKAGYVGKWHIGDEVKPQHGFEDYWISTEDCYNTEDEHEKWGFCSYRDYLLEKGYTPEAKNGTFRREQTVGLPEEDSRIAFITKEANRFLEENKDNDFVLAVNYLEPHPPYEGPTDDLYDRDKIELMPNYTDESTDGMSLRSEKMVEYCQTRSQSLEKPFNEDDENHSNMKDLQARYYGLVDLADKYTGMVIDKLKELGLYDNTMIVYTTDHGDMMGSHGMLNKCVMYDEALVIPFMVRHPEYTAEEKRILEAANITDIVPTVLSGIGKDIPEAVQGEDLMPLIKGEREDNLEKGTISEWNGRLQRMHGRHEDIFKDVEHFFIRSIRTPKWKLNVNLEDKWELYDLENDSLEMNNLIYDSSKKDIIELLLSQLKDWQKKTDDKVEIPEVTASC
ncbi:MAG: sulfatase-like hydrolase/transferase [Planctomycetota bacterium]